MKLMAKRIDECFNCGPVSEEAIESLAKETHRTIYQNITRFALMWLKHIGTHECGFDYRNAASVITAKELCEKEGVLELLDRALPYI